MKIPGWEKITNKQVKDVPGAQIVNGQWYRAIGCDSLQATLWDMWLVGVLELWERESIVMMCVKSGKKSRKIPFGRRDVAEAEKTLREFGIIDEKGNVIEG